MKKTLVLLIVISTCAFKNVNAQRVLIADLSPNVGSIDINHLQMVSISNPNTGPIRGTLRMSLTGASGQIVATNRTSNFMIAPGRSVVGNEIWWEPRMMYGTNDLARSFRKRGTLSVGDYVLCFSFEDEIGQSLGRTCTEKRAESLQQFQLLSPAHKSIISEMRPLLVWEQALGYSINISELTYELKLTSVRKGQSLQEALEQNVPLLTRQRISVTQLLYPASSPPLETGKVYVWSVEVYRGNDRVASSATWSFSIGAKRLTNLAKGKGYVMLTTTSDCQPHRVDKSIMFAMDNNEGMKLLNYSIVDIGDLSWRPKGLPIFNQLVPGLNTFTLPVHQLGLRKKRQYRIEVNTPRGQRYYLRFTYKS